MGSKATKETTSKLGYVPVTTVVGYNVDYVPYCGTIVPVKRPMAGVVPVAVTVKDETVVPKPKPNVSKVKYSDNDVKVKATWNGSDLKISKKCK